MTAPRPGDAVGAAGVASDPPALEARGVGFRIGHSAVLESVDLRVRAGEIVAVLGPNGAGKSTLVRLLLGLERPHEGDVLLQGSRLSDAPEARRRTLTGLLQRSPLFAGTVARNVCYGLRVRGVARAARAARVDAALSRMGVAHLGGRDVRSLSGGEAQRVAVARALVLDPAMLVLDEPGADLDVASRRRLLRDLETAVRTGDAGTLIVTHDPREAFALADRVYVLERGRVVQEGSPADLIADPATPFVAQLTGAELVVDGTFAGHRNGLAEVALGGGLAWRAIPATDPEDWPPGCPVHFAYRPEDIALAALDATSPSSPRNRADVEVVSLAPLGGGVRVRLRGPIPLVALVTRDGAEALELAPGRRVSALLKAMAARAYRAGPRASFPATEGPAAAGAPASEVAVASGTSADSGAAADSGASVDSGASSDSGASADTAGRRRRAEPVEEIRYRIAVGDVASFALTASRCDPSELAAGHLFARGYAVESLRSAAFRVDDADVTVGFADPPAAPVRLECYPPEGGAVASHLMSCARCAEDAVRAREAASAGPTTFGGAVWDVPAEPALRSIMAEVFGPASGVHAAALVDGDALVLRVEDVARHAAVDRLVGAAILRGWLPGRPLGLATTARISGEIAHKAARAGLAWVASRSVPTTLALDVAARVGMPIVARAGSPSARTFGP